MNKEQMFDELKHAQSRVVQAGLDKLEISKEYFEKYPDVRVHRGQYVVDGEVVEVTGDPSKVSLKIKNKEKGSTFTIRLVTYFKSLERQLSIK